MRVSLNISTSSFVHNVATKDGGGLYVGGYSSSNKGKLLLIEKSKFMYNIAGYKSTSSYQGHGGAIYIYTANVHVRITNCHFDSNLANDEGGAMGISTIYEMSIAQSIFSNNSASTGGALQFQIHVDGIFAVINTLFSSNLASNGNGGSISITGRYSSDKANAIGICFRYSL